jgi:hypothetical protein
MKCTIAAVSRKFPPHFKRRWYIVKCNGEYIVRHEGRTMKQRYRTLGEAIDRALNHSL